VQIIKLFSMSLFNYFYFSLEKKIFFFLDLLLFHLKVKLIVLKPLTLIHKSVVKKSIYLMHSHKQVKNNHKKRIQTKNKNKNQQMVIQINPKQHQQMKIPIKKKKRNPKNNFQQIQSMSVNFQNMLLKMM
jgi:hypothetical protein